MPKPRNQSPHFSRIDGRGQLTLVEQSLCPLHAADSLQPNLVHQSSYYFTDKNRHKQKATATIHAPLGLSANDELYLMGLLGLDLLERRRVVYVFVEHVFAWQCGNHIIYKPPHVGLNLGQFIA